IRSTESVRPRTLSMRFCISRTPPLSPAKTSMWTVASMPAANPSTRAGPGAHLRVLGLELPTVPKPLGNYVEVSQVGSLLFISGTLPVANGKLTITGRLGDSLSVEQGREAARLAAMNALAAVQEHLGDLDRVKRLVKVNVYV